MARNQTGGPRGAERATLRGGTGLGGHPSLTALTPSFLGGQGSSSVCSQTYKTTKVFISSVILLVVGGNGFQARGGEREDFIHCYIVRAFASPHHGVAHHSDMNLEVQIDDSA